MAAPGAVVGNDLGVRVAGAAAGQSESTLSQLANNVEQSERAVGVKWKGNKDKKYKMYKEHYKTSIKQDEVVTTKEIDKKDTAFVDPGLKGVQKSGIGSGVIYPTAELAKDDKMRIQFGISPRGVISNPLNVYSSSDVTVVSLKSADQFFDSIIVGGGPDQYDQNDKLNREAKRRGFADYAAWANDQNSKGDALAYFAKIDKVTPRTARTLNIPYLRGVTVFMPLIPPPKDKSMEDYLNDVKRFNLGSPVTAIQQSLGQACYRGLFTIKQAGLNQSMMLTETKFFRMSMKNNGADPMTTVKEPRIVMFYKKFIDCDDAIQKTIPNGESYYKNIAPSREDIEELMKTYLSSPAFGERLLKRKTNNGSYQGDPAIDEAFQNIQIHEDVHEMIRHTLFGAYVNLVTTIADFYIMSEKWEATSPVGSFAGYPPGLIMPCHVYNLFIDEAMSLQNKLRTIPAKGNRLEEKYIYESGDRKIAEHLRETLYKNGHPYFQAIHNLRKSFLTRKINDSPIHTRLFKDGTEWLNSLTPNSIKLVWGPNQQIADNAINDLIAVDEVVVAMAKKSLIYSSSIPVDLEAIDNNGKHLSKPSNSKSIDIDDDNHLTKTLDRNSMIYNAIKPYIQPDMAPTGPQIFSQWKMTEDQLLDIESSTIKTGKPQPGWDLTTFRQKNLIANSAPNFRYGGRFKQGNIGNIKI